MPPIFKALVTIIVWILFIKGCVMILAGTYVVAIAGVTLVSAAECGIGIVALILAAVAAKLRQMLE